MIYQQCISVHFTPRGERNSLDGAVLVFMVVWGRGGGFYFGKDYTTPGKPMLGTLAWNDAIGHAALFCSFLANVPPLIPTDDTSIPDFLDFISSTLAWMGRWGCLPCHWLFLRVTCSDGPKVELHREKRWTEKVTVVLNSAGDVLIGQLPNGTLRETNQRPRDGLISHFNKETAGLRAATQPLAVTCLSGQCAPYWVQTRSIFAPHNM